MNPKKKTLYVYLCRMVHMACGTGGFGFSLSGNAPVFIRSVEPRGPAGKAGLRAGDYLLELNGLDIRYSIYILLYIIIHEVSKD